MEINDGLNRVGEIGKVWATQYATGWAVYALPVLPHGGLVESGLTKDEAIEVIERTTKEMSNV